jgi:Ca2+-binding EF-hand superfamily protein
LIETSAANVRRLGLAPKTSEQYKSDTDRKASRKKMFTRMDTDGSGRITFDEYVRFTLSHLKGKLGVSAVAKSVMSTPSKDEFISRLKRAMDDRTGFEAKNLYRELFGHFESADHDRDGRVDFDQFEALIEASAAQVRRLGLAPPTNKMYSNDKNRIAARKKMFNAMDTDGNGTITFNEYYNFTITHIKGKINQVAREQSQKDKAAEYMQFLKRAVSNRNGEESRVFYRELFSHFMEADKDMDGLVKREEFDGLIEASAAKVRRLGLAPSEKEMFKSDKDKQLTRKKVFATMNKSGDGMLKFDEYLAYTWDHLRAKLQSKTQPSKTN